MNQTPSVGRIVHYVLDDRRTTNAGASRPAIITHVHDNDDVALSVFPFPKLDGSETVMAIAQSRPDEGLPDKEGVLRYKPGTWHWPPYVAPKRQADVNEDAKPDLAKASYPKAPSLEEREPQYSKPYPLGTDKMPEEAKPETAVSAPEPTPTADGLPFEEEEEDEPAST